MGLHCYAVSIHRDELVLEPPLKNPGSAYGDPPEPGRWGPQYTILYI